MSNFRHSMTWSKSLRLKACLRMLNKKRNGGASGHNRCNICLNKPLPSQTHSASRIWPATTTGNRPPQGSTRCSFSKSIKPSVQSRRRLLVTSSSAGGQTLVLPVKTCIGRFSVYFICIYSMEVSLKFLSPSFFHVSCNQGKSVFKWQLWALTLTNSM